MDLQRLISPVAVSTPDCEVLSFSAGRVMSAKPATTRPCREENTFVLTTVVLKLSVGTRKGWERRKTLFDYNCISLLYILK